MKMKTTKFLAVLAVMVMAFAAVAVTSDDSVDATSPITDRHTVDHYYIKADTSGGVALSTVDGITVTDGATIKVALSKSVTLYDIITESESTTAPIEFDLNGYTLTIETTGGHGIETNGAALTVKNGTIIVKVDSAAQTTQTNVGIEAKSLTLDGLTASEFTVNIAGYAHDDAKGAGVKSSNGALIINNSNITINTNDRGLYAYSGTASNATVEVKGTSNVVINTGAYGIRAGGTVEISNSATVDINIADVDGYEEPAAVYSVHNGGAAALTVANTAKLIVDKGMNISAAANNVTFDGGNLLNYTAHADSNITYFTSGKGTTSGTWSVSEVSNGSRTITLTGYSGNGFFKDANNALVVSFSGTNTITTDAGVTAASDYESGIYGKGVTIKASADNSSLTVNMTTEYAGAAVLSDQGDLIIGDNQAGAKKTVLNVSGAKMGLYLKPESVTTVNTTIQNSEVTASASEKAITSTNQTPSLTISNGSIVNATLSGTKVTNNSGDDDFYGAKVRGDLTVSDNSVLNTKGLRVDGTVTTTTGKIFVTGGYTNEVGYVGGINLTKAAGTSQEQNAVNNEAITLIRADAAGSDYGVYISDDAEYYTAGYYKITVKEKDGKESYEEVATTAAGVKTVIAAAPEDSEEITVVIPKDNAAISFTGDNIPVVPAGSSLTIKMMGATTETTVTGTITVTGSTGDTNSVNISNFKGTASFSYGSIGMVITDWEGGDITLAAGDVLKISSDGVGINANATITGPSTGSATVLVESGRTLTVNPGKTLSLVGNINMNNDGNIVGRGTIDVGADATFYTFTTVSVYLTGDGTIITEDSMEDVEISGYLTSSMKATPTQRVIVTSNLTIRAGEYLVITGELVVPEGVTVSIEEGGLLMLTDPTAHAEIYGTIKASGKSAVAVADYNNKAAFTVDSSANKVPVIIYGSVIAAKATSDDITSVNLQGLTEIYGSVTVNNKAAANFAANAVVEATGTISVSGTFSGTISNEGLIEISGSAAAGTIIKMAAADAKVDVKALKSAAALTITDLDMYLMTVEGVAQKVTEDDDNTITLQNVGGILIEEDIVYSLDAAGNRDATNYTYVSGITGFGDSKTVQIPTIGITEGESVVITNLDLVKTVLNINADVLVSGTITVNNEDSFVLYGQDTPRYANIVVNSGETTVTGMIQVTGHSLADTSEANIIAVKYTNRVDLKDVYYYTTLKTAIASGEKDFEVLKGLLVLEDTVVPAGVTVDASGKSVVVGFPILAPEAELVISDGANLTAKDITVIGTLYIADVDTGINCSNIVSDTSSFGDEDALYTNLYNALSQAESGDTVKVTSKNNEVFLAKDATVKTGVTLIIPGSKALKIFEGVTFTVDGLLQNKGTISAYYLNDNGDEQVGTFAEKAKADATTHAACIKVNGMIESTTGMTYAVYKIPGAYYTSKTMNYITTVEAASLVATSVDGCKIDIYGTLKIGDVAFIGTESKNLEINVYGTTAAQGTFTVDTMTIAYGAIKFKTAGTILNGTFGTVTGSVKLANVETVAVASLDNMISDYIYADGEEDVSVMAFQGSYKHSTLDVDAKKATAFTFDGDVAVKNNLTLDGKYNSTNGTFKVDSDASMGVFNGATLSINDAAVTIDGTVMVFSNAKMNVTTDATHKASVTVNGTFIAADGSDEDYDVSGDVIVDGQLTANAGAIVGGKVVPDLLTIMPGAIVVGELLETITAPNAAYTEFYVEKALWKTVYLIDSNAAVDEIHIYKHAAPGLKDCVQGKYNGDGETGYKRYIWAKTDGSSTAVTGDIGSANKVYAYIIYDIYLVTIYTDAGVKSVSIDNKVLVSPASGQNMFYTVDNLKAGVHKVSYTLKDGYEGEAVLYTSEHTILPNLSFETAGNDDYSYALGYMEFTFELSGTDPVPTPEPEPTPTPEEQSEWTVTTILLCVLVVLIAIMAVIVALRLNRN